MFKSITSEEKEAKLKRDVQEREKLRCDVKILNEQVVQKQLVVNNLKKGHVGKPRKVVVTILSPQDIKS
jgi:hypothetical protein